MKITKLTKSIILEAYEQLLHAVSLIAGIHLDQEFSKCGHQGRTWASIRNLWEMQILSPIPEGPKQKS